MSNHEPLILAIETATRAGNVALARGSRILSSAVGNATESHSVGLLTTIENVLRESHAKLSDIDLFAAAKGPGSFTGLRIGLATVKALAVCSGKSCAGISTLAAIAHAAGQSENTVALLPAGRGELFAQLFSVDAVGVHMQDSATHITPDRLHERYGHLENLLWAGEGAHLYADTLRVNGWSLAPEYHQLATAVAALAFCRFSNGSVLDPADLRADYVRASDAELKSP